MTVESRERRQLAPRTAAGHVQAAVQGFPEPAAPLLSLPAASKLPPSFRLSQVTLGFSSLAARVHMMPAGGRGAGWVDKAGMEAGV